MPFLEVTTFKILIHILLKLVELLKKRKLFDKIITKTKVLKMDLMRCVTLRKTRNIFLG